MIFGSKTLDKRAGGNEFLQNDGRQNYFFTAEYLARHSRN